MIKKYIYEILFFLFYLSVGTLPPYIYIHFKHNGFTASQISYIAMVSPLTIIISQLFWGMAADAIISRRLLIRFSFLFTSLNVFLFLNVRSLPATMLVMMLWVFFYSHISPLIDASALEIGARRAVPLLQQEIGLGYGRKRWWGSFSFCLAALLVGMLTDWFSLRVIFPVFSAIMMVSFIIATAGFDEIPRPAGRPNLKQYGRDLRSIIRQPDIRWLSIGIILSFMTFSGNAIVYGLYWESLGGSGTLLGLSWVIAAAIEIPLFIRFDWLAGRYTLKSMLMLSGAAAICRWTLYLLFPSPLGLLVAQVFHGISFIFMTMPAMIYLARNVPVSLKNSGQTYLSAIAFGLGALLGNFLSGQIVDSGGYEMWYGLSIIINGLAIFIFSKM